MDARTKSDDISLVVDQDYTTCPLTYQIFRHPILASDGKRYELKAFVEYVKNMVSKIPRT